MPISKDEKDYLWEHFKFNADQRIKAFNFFVVFSVFSNGGAFAAFEKGYSSSLTTAIGIFIIVLAIIFFAIDRRSRHLTNLAIPGLIAFEQQLEDPQFRLFYIDRNEQSKIFRYSVAFNTLYITEIIFGAFVIYFGLH
jgi:hypothetical protein